MPRSSASYAIPVSRRSSMSASREYAERVTMRRLFSRVRHGAHSKKNLKPHSHWCGSMRRRKSSGESGLNHHLRSFSGASGVDHGSEWLTEIWPPLANEVSSPAPSRRSTTVTSWPCPARYQAVEVPITPAPRTRIFMGGTHYTFRDHENARIR